MASLRLTALNDIADTADQALQEIRTTSYLVHPPLLDEAGLASAARWYTVRDSGEARSTVWVRASAGGC
jgi:signal transduction histidine kinase